MNQSNFSVIVFDKPTAVKQALSIIEDVCAASGITIKNAATLTWPMGRRRPLTNHLNGLANSYALSGAFWGMFFGLLFFIPDFGMIMAATMGSLVGRFSDFGLNKRFMNCVRESVTEGTSALFLIAGIEEFNLIVTEIREKGPQFEIISTDLTVEQDQKLEEDFGT